MPLIVPALACARDVGTPAACGKPGTATAAALAATLHSKLDAVATDIANRRLQAERDKTEAVEMRLADVRALETHQTEMQNRLDTKRQAAIERMGVFDASIREKMGIGDFKRMQLSQSNGPTVLVGALTEEDCSSDQFYSPSCAKKQVAADFVFGAVNRSEEHTSELQSP